MPILSTYAVFLLTDSTKVLIFALAAILIFFVIRRFSRRSETSYDFGSSPELFGDAPRPVHASMRFDEIELRSFYMHQFDVLSGPPDPFEFVDELTAEVEHLKTGARSTWNFTIGTPSGFARLLEGKRWESFYSPEIFVIRKYELDMVREMIVEHITSLLGESPRQPDSSVF